MKLRWKKHPHETGLRAIAAGPRGSDLWDGTDQFATVYAHSTRHTGKIGWYWVASGLVPYKNTCDVVGKTEEEAKAEAKVYVTKHLKSAAPK